MESQVRSLPRQSGWLASNLLGQARGEVPTLNTRRKLLSGVCAVTAVVIGAAACSSSSKSTSSNPTNGSSSSSQGTTGAAAASATGAPIKVGLICSCSGPFGANNLPVEDTYKAWVNTVNASGGISGHQIQLITEDDAANPGTSASEAQTLISDHVVAIADNSDLDETWASKVQASGIPVVGVDLASAPFYSYSDFYPEGQTNDSVTYANVSTAKAAGASNIGDLYCAEAVQCAEGVPQIKAAAQKLGLSNTYNAEIAMSAPDYTAQCVAAQDGHVQSLFIGDSSTIIARVGADCSRQGYNPIYITEGLGYSSILANSDGIKNNLWDEFNTLPYFANAPEVQAMNVALDKYYPGLRENQNTFSELAAQAWVSGLLLEDAVKASGLSATGTPTAQEITKGLTSLHGDTLDGWSPPLTFTAGQPHHVDCWFTAKVKNGVPSLANDGKTTCVSASS